MTIDVSNNNPRIEYSVSQGASQSVFTVPFEFFDNSDVKVYVDDVLKSEGADYVLGGGDGSTGTLTFSSPVVGATGGSIVVLARHTSLERTTDFVAGQDINRAALNEQLDTIVAQIADLDDRVDRTIHLNDSEVAPSMLLTDDRKGRVMAFNSSTGAVEAGPLSNDIATIADNIDELLAVNDEAAAAAASATAAATSATAAQTAQAAAELAETTALIAENAAGIAQTNAAASAAAALASETAAAASEAGVDADRVAAQAAATAAAASEAAAAESATNAATSETNAANSATASASSATASAASATAASASESAAAASEAAAATSETNAATSETNAAASAATATTQASNAATSATAAAVSAASIVGDVADAQAAATQAQGYRDTASLHKLAAEAAATSATNTAAALTGFDLEAIAESKAVTAVDVFVYDTSKDSDGGAWRKRTQGTSWYQETLNTATRGSRREFPAVAVIVAESNKVTIYDGDDPSLPMWMVFNVFITYSQSMITAGNRPSTLALSFLNGLMVVGSQNGSAGNTGVNGLFRVDFISDTGRKTNAGVDKLFRAGIDKRNTTGFVNYLTDPDISSARLVNANVNDVAMTVLPDAPIDPATGLPVPTIAVATAGGVSVIKDDGTVVDSVAFPAVTLEETSQGVWWLRSPGGIVYFASWGTIQAGDGFGDAVADRDAGDLAFDLLAVPQGGISEMSEGSLGFAGISATGNAVPGLMLHQPNYTDQSKGMSALTTSTYNTGWMPANIKGAFLSDTDDTDLVESGELVTNGTFDTDVSGWTAGRDGEKGDFSVVSGALRIATVIDGLARPRIVQAITTIPGRRYRFSVRVVAQSGTSERWVFWNTTSAGIGGTTLTGAAGIGVSSYEVTATSTTTYISVGIGSTLSGSYADFDDISVVMLDADRSVNANGLIVNGTVTRTPVATGADLVAYSGFSASNYLEQPYNSDLDFGTGDFCVMGWMKMGVSGTYRPALSKAPLEPVSPFFLLEAQPDNKIAWVGNNTTSRLLTQILPTNAYSQVAFVRASGVGYLYVDGKLVDSAANTDNYDHSNTDILQVGYRSDNYAGTFSGSLALLRISATAPTAEQIAKIYNDEKVLFQENAQATLYGTSDAVTALAHDDATGILSVGTSAGRSDFQGLRRVNNTTTAVWVAISASNGMIVEE